jgi:PTS system galactosamine-specific IIB component
MKELNIVLTRIDNRLVHGQVGVAWCRAVGCNLIMVADDLSAKDELQQQLMGMTAMASKASIRFYSVEDCAKSIASSKEDDKIFLICRTPKAVRQLVEANVPIAKVNIGNMHFEVGKRSLSRKVYVSQEDEEDLKYLTSKGIKVYIQDLPGDDIINL